MRTYSTENVQQNKEDATTNNRKDREILSMIYCFLRSITNTTDEDPLTIKEKNALFNKKKRHIIRPRLWLTIKVSYFIRSSARKERCDYDI